MEHEENQDNLKLAIDGLNQFTKNWCMNCKETKKHNQPIFRCSECNFRVGGGLCLIKKFVFDKAGYMPVNFGSMHH